MDVEGGGIRRLLEVEDGREIACQGSIAPYLGAVNVYTIEVFPV